MNKPSRIKDGLNSTDYQTVAQTLKHQNDISSYSLDHITKVILE